MSGVASSMRSRLKQESVEIDARNLTFKYEIHANICFKSKCVQVFVLVSKISNVNQDIKILNCPLVRY